MLNKPSQSSILIDVRCYGEESQTHHHDFHQLVLPVSGVLALKIDGLQGQVGSEYAAVITADNRHAFCAEHENQFIVANVPLAWTNIVNNLALSTFLLVRFPASCNPVDPGSIFEIETLFL